MANTTMTRAPMTAAGQKTRENLKAAFHAETGVYFKYTLWADRARKAGHHAVGALFDQVARNEWAHAKIWYKQLNGEINTQEALLAAAGGEHHEWSEMYALWADEARDEGETRIEALFRGVASIEAEHEAEYRRMAKLLSDGEEFCAGKPVQWVCANCGYRHEGTEPPEKCPVCEHPKAYFARQ